MENVNIVVFPEETSDFITNNQELNTPVVNATSCARQYSGRWDLKQNSELRLFSADLFCMSTCFNQHADSIEHSAEYDSTILSGDGTFQMLSDMGGCQTNTRCE